MSKSKHEGWWWSGDEGCGESGDGGDEDGEWMIIGVLRTNEQTNRWIARQTNGHLWL